MGNRDYQEKFFGAEYAKEAPYQRFRSKVIDNLAEVKRLDFAAAGVDISGVALQYPAKIIAVGHGLITGDRVYLKGIEGTVELNDKDYAVTKVNNDQYTLDGVDSTNYTTYISGGRSFKLESLANTKIHSLTFTNDGTATLYIAESEAKATADEAGIILKENGTYDELVDDLSRLWVGAGAGTVDLRLFIRKYGEGN